MTRDLRARRFGVVADFQGTFKSALLARLTGARGCFEVRAAQTAQHRLQLERLAAGDPSGSRARYMPTQAWACHPNIRP